MQDDEVDAVRPDLESLLGPLADSLPRHVIDGNTESLILTAQNLPQPPSIVTSSDFWMRLVGLRFYDNFPVDSVDLCADKRCCTTLGLLLLAVVFHQEPVTVDIEVNHPGSWITHLRVRYPQEAASSYSEGYGTLPAFFAWRPREVERYPFLRADAPHDPFDLPKLQITTQDEMGPVPGVKNNFWEEFDHRDTVLVESTDRGTIRLAELLLNAGLEDNAQDEFTLESEAGGLRGVAPGSAELRIWLPGSMGYDPNDRR